MKKKIVALIIGICVILGISFGVAEASIPDSSGTIHGCYNNYRGDLRVIDSSSQSCLADETALNWSQSVPTTQLIQETFAGQFTTIGGNGVYQLTNNSTFSVDCPLGTVPIDFQSPQFDRTYGSNLTMKFISTEYNLNSSGVPTGFKVQPVVNLGDSVSETLNFHYYLVCQ